jgi:hypothetical protein
MRAVGIMHSPLQQMPCNGIIVFAGGSEDCILFDLSVTADLC